VFKKILPLNLILFFRFLGLFLVLPLISIYASELPNSTPLLVGVVIGGYALTQALFQIPFGILSDKFGRKALILFGMVLFLIGSVIAYLANDIYTLIMGRLLQGAGAVGSVISAAISDVVPEEKRGKAMAMVGGSIAIAFAIAMVVGSVVGGYFGVDILFLITSILAFLAIVVAVKLDTIPKIEFMYSRNGEKRNLLGDSNLLYLFWTSLLQKGMMSIVFMVIPILLTSSGEWSKEELWKLYIPAMVLGLLSMGPAVIFGEKKGKPKIVFLISSFLFVLTALLLAKNSVSTTILALFVFFVAFNLIEPLIQSMVSKLVRVTEKGKALGYTNSFAYFGTFLGGTGAGLFLENGDIEKLAYLLIALSTIWLVWTLRFRNPELKGNIYLDHSNSLQSKIEGGNFTFIDEWYINRSENLIVIRYSRILYSEDEIRDQLGVK